MTNLDYLFAVDMAFRDVVIELAAHAIGTTNPEFAEEWLETEVGDAEHAVEAPGKRRGE